MLRSFAALGFAGLLTTTAAGQPPAPDADPLPPGAVARFGTTRLRGPFSWPTTALTPDGKALLSHLRGEIVRVDLATGRVEKAPDSDVPQVYSADGKVAASAAGGVRVWKVGGGPRTDLTSRQFSNVSVQPLSLSGDGRLLAVGFDRNGGRTPGEPSALVWDMAANRAVAELAVEQNGSVSVVLSPDGKTLATWGIHYDPARPFGAENPGGWPEEVVQLWDVATGKVLARVDAGGVPAAVAFSPDSSRVAVSTGSGGVSLRDARTGLERRFLLARHGVGLRLTFSPDGTALMAFNPTGGVQRWTVPDGRPLGYIEPPQLLHKAFGELRVRGVTWTGPDRAVAWGEFVVAAVAWELPSGRILTPQPTGHHAAVNAVGFSPDGRHVVSAGLDMSILRWDVKTGAAIGPRWDRFLPLGFRPFLPARGNRVIGDHHATVYDTETATELYRIPALRGRRGSAAAVGISDDGERAVTVTRPEGGPADATEAVEVWDLATSRRLRRVDQPRTDTFSARLSPDGTALVGWGRRGNGTTALVGWDLTTGDRFGDGYPVGAPFELLFGLPPGDAAHVAFVEPKSKDRLTVVDYRSGKDVLTVALGRKDATTRPVFSPDGKLMAVGFGSEELKPARPEVRLFDWPSGSLRRTLPGHLGPVRALAFSADSKFLASGSSDTTVLLWDVTAAGKE